MKQGMNKLAAAALMVLATLSSGAALAQHRGYEGGREWGQARGYERGYEHGRNWAWGLGGLVAGVALAETLAPHPVYAAPAPVYVVRPPAVYSSPAVVYTPAYPAVNAVPAPVPVNNWYYCQRPQGYYPYVQQCYGQWIAVPAAPGG